ncbi:MAG: hypothetical protein HY075_15490 [Deltaproteobacteria bacterium]|nr:hypothetical protein [Deltaproteobacteria bacterium]
MTAKNLGEILLEQGIIDRDALDRALQIQNRRLGEILIEERLADPVAIAQALKFQARARTGRRTTRLSVETAALDDILRRLEHLEDQVGVDPAQAPPYLSSLTSLRQSVELLMLEPVDTIFNKARWIAEHASGELGKTVKLVCEGGGITIDRMLVEELADMALHLVRNAIDHGLEAPGDRVSAAKDSTGTIRMGVATYGGRLVLSVTDDGRGIDEDAVFERAVQKGLLAAGRDEVDSQALFRFLFTPGFSTRESATALSGRGVGLDVVEAAAIRLGGDVGVTSQKGSGATFRISVPLQSARLTVLPLRAGDEWVAVNAAEITAIERTSDPAGLLLAASMFPGSAPLAPARAPFLKVECLGGSRWAFDEVGQPEDVLVREASAFAKGSHGVIGGARMRSGRSMLLVDLELLSAIATPLSTT